MKHLFYMSLYLLLSDFAYSNYRVVRMRYKQEEQNLFNRFAHEGNWEQMREVRTRKSSCCCKAIQVTLAMMRTCLCGISMTTVDTHKIPCDCEL